MNEISSTSPGSEHLSWFEQLLPRRVPQVLIAYAGTCWGIVQFVDWLCGRYALSPYLTDVFVYLSVLLLPGAFLLAYFRGDPGRTPWTRYERIGIPVNLAVAVVVLVSSFWGKELGPINQTVTIKDDNGRTTEREVPKSAFRKRIALYFLENTGSDRTLDWLQQGLPNLLATDLSQDLYLEVRDGYDLAGRLQKAGFSYRDTLALGLMRDIARYYYLDYIVAGTFKKTNNQYIVQLDLYETKRVQRISRHLYRTENLFELVDDLSIQLKRDVGVPDQHIESSTDFPVAEISTRSLTALEHFVAARSAKEFDQDPKTAEKQYELATLEDPGFAMAHMFQFINYFNSGQISRANAEIRKAKHFIFKLTDQYRLRLNAWSFFAAGQGENELKALKQWVALYPDSTEAYRRLGRHYANAAELDSAVAAYQRVLELDPEQHATMNDIGDLYATRGRYPEALDYYQKAGASQTSPVEALLKAAPLYLLQAQFERARDAYRQILAIDTNNAAALSGLGTIALRTGNFDQALGQFNLALQQSQGPAEKADVYSELDDYYKSKRRWQKVIANLQSLVAQKQKTAAIEAMLTQTYLLDRYVYAGRKDEAFAAVNAIESQAKSVPLLHAFAQLGLLRIYLALEDVRQAEPLILQVRRTFEAYGLAQLSKGSRLGWAQARAAELRQDFKAASRLYEQYCAENPTDPLARVDLGRTYREAQDLAGAEAALLRALTFFPAYPEAHYELAVVYARKGDRDAARKEVRTALTTWSGADPGDRLVEAARALQLELQK